MAGNKYESIDLKKNELITEVIPVLRQTTPH